MIIDDIDDLLIDESEDEDTEDLKKIEETSKIITYSLDKLKAVISSPFTERAEDLYAKQNAGKELSGEDFFEAIVLANKSVLYANEKEFEKHLQFKMSFSDIFDGYMYFDTSNEGRASFFDHLAILVVATSVCNSFKSANAETPDTISVVIDAYKYDFKWTSKGSEGYYCLQSITFNANTPSLYSVYMLNAHYERIMGVKNGNFALIYPYSSTGTFVRSYADIQTPTEPVKKSKSTTVYQAILNYKNSKDVLDLGNEILAMIQGLDNFNTSEFTPISLEVKDKKANYLTFKDFYWK